MGFLCTYKRDNGVWNYFRTHFQDNLAPFFVLFGVFTATFILEKKENRNEVLFLSLTVSLVTSLSSFHSFMVKQELIVNNSIVGSLGFYMVSPQLLITPFKMHCNSKKVVLKRDVLSWLRRIFSKQREKRRRFQFKILLYKIIKSVLTENSKVMVILKEPRLGYSRTNITLTVHCQDS